MVLPSKTCRSGLELQGRSENDIPKEALAKYFYQVRRLTEKLCEPLAIEDYVVQSMPDASPAKWHLAHTSWFFENFVLPRLLPDYRPFSAAFNYLFNSYYNSVGARIPRPQRGILSRPTVDEVYRYRKYIDERMLQLLEDGEENGLRQITPLIVLGLNHEQQHQELLLTDIKHLFGSNPLRPAYQNRTNSAPARNAAIRWNSFPAGLHWIGHQGHGFAFDNETPRHQVFFNSYQIASRLTTNAEYLAFMADGGYERPEFWLSDGWNARCAHDWSAPLYWEKQQKGWQTFTLTGPRDLDEAEPVCHVSYYEADAFACWRGARLPTEGEWEVAAEPCPVTGNLLDTGNLHPVSGPEMRTGESLSQIFGDVWEWTRSPYTAYPGYKPAIGALGEYNGKFMCNQMVLRGGSCVTPLGHMRGTYRNFFPPETRWQFSGIRLAKDL